MRITPFIIFNQLTRSLGRSLQDYGSLNEQLASGKRIQAPSDDVNGLKRTMDYNVRINNNSQYQQNIEFAQNGLNAATAVINSYQTFLTTATALISQNKSGTQDEATRIISAQKAASVRDILLDLGNTRTNDQYLFAGFKSDTPPFDAGTYDYVGDNGVVNVPVDNGSTLAANITGSSLFSYTLPEATSRQLSNGKYVSYTPGAGTTVDVEIRDTDNATVLDSFSFSNIIQMTDTLSTAISDNNTLRLEALVDPFQQAQTQLRAVQGDVNSRTMMLDLQSSTLSQNSDALKNVLAVNDQADMVEVFAKLKTTEITLQAVRESAARVMSQSLFDFLR